MLDRLARHSPRPLPAGVAEALRTWAGRRERVTYYASATLIEFATPRGPATRPWPTGPPRPGRRRCGSPTGSCWSRTSRRSRSSGSGWPARATTAGPPEACVEVEPDGVTLTLDLARSDLLVDAELARFADELPPEPADGHARQPAAAVPRLAGVARPGGRERPDARPAVALVHPADRGRDPPRGPPAPAGGVAPRAAARRPSRPLVLRAPSAELLDGLLQHPDDPHLPGRPARPDHRRRPRRLARALRRALEGLGLALPDPPSSARPPARPARRAARRG